MAAKKKKKKDTVAKAKRELEAKEQRAQASSDEDTDPNVQHTTHHGNSAVTPGKAEGAATLMSLRAATRSPLSAGVSALSISETLKSYQVRATVKGRGREGASLSLSLLTPLSHLFASPASQSSLEQLESRVSNPPPVKEAGLLAHPPVEEAMRKVKDAQGQRGLEAGKKEGAREAQAGAPKELLVKLAKLEGEGRG